MESLKLDKSERIEIRQDRSFQISIDSENEVTLSLAIAAGVRCSLFVECLRAKAVHLCLEGQSESMTTLLFWNRCDTAMMFHDEVHLYRNAVLNLSYGELAQGDFRRKAALHLDEEGASLTLRTATLSQSEKNYQINCIHHARHTRSEMKNYFVLLEGGSCRMEAVGKIEKGAGQSQSHQVSRGLTFDQLQRAVILPQLLIDENDVEASHATTLGQIDEEQMYYLQSRGLTRKEAMQLITTGYLLPVAEAIEDESLRQRCQDEIEMKVNESCSM